LLSDNTKARLQLKEHPDKGVFVEGLLEEVGRVLWFEEVVIQVKEEFELTQT
jgi:hypothetical protein